MFETERLSVGLWMSFDKFGCPLIFSGLGKVHALGCPTSFLRTTEIEITKRSNKLVPTNRFECCVFVVSILVFI